MDESSQFRDRHRGAGLARQRVYRAALKHLSVYAPDCPVPTPGAALSAFLRRQYGHRRSDAALPLPFGCAMQPQERGPP